MSTKNDRLEIFRTDTIDWRSDEETAIASLPRFGGSRGAVAFSWDDGWDSHRQVAQWHADRGQRATFYITTSLLDGDQHLASADVAAIHAMGHEIGAHNVDHVSMTGLTAATRATQWDTPKAVLEAMIGEPVVSYAYPLGDNSFATDQEAYGRYDRVAYTGLSQGYIGSSTKAGNWMLSKDFSAFGHGRFPWNQDTHPQFMRLLAEAVLRNDVTIPVYAHQVGNSDTPTEAQVLEALDFVQANGIRTLTAKGSTPGPLVTNPGFENDLDGWIVIKAGAGSGSTVDVVTDAPATGFGGTKSLRIQSTAATSSDSVTVAQVVPAIGGQAYTASARIRHDGAPTEGGKFSIRINEFGEDGRTISGRSVRGTASTSSWAQSTAAPTATGDSYLTLPAGHLHPDTRLVQVALYVQQLTGTFYADHVHFGPTRNGVLG